MPVNIQKTIEELNWQNFYGEVKKMKKQGIFPLPGSSYPLLTLIIRAYANWSNESVSAATLHENSFMKLSAGDISRNSKFLVAMGIIDCVKQVKKLRFYKVTKIGIRLGKAYSSSEAVEVSKIWRELVEKQDFFQRILNAIKFNESMDKSDLKKQIVFVSGNSQTWHTINAYAVTIIDIMKAANLVIEPSRNLIRIKPENPLSEFISFKRIHQLRNIEHEKFDLSRLIMYCDEVNDNYQNGNYASVGFLSRAIVDHIPPVFDKLNFESVAAQVPGDRHRSFKKSCENLGKSLKNIVDHSIHKQISSAEIPPIKEEVNFSQDINNLLGRVVEELIRTGGKYKET